MARTWYAGPATGRNMPPPKNRNVTTFKEGEPPPYDTLHDTAETNYPGTAVPGGLTKVPQSNKDISAYQAKLPQHSSKPRDQQTVVASKEQNTFKPRGKMDNHGPSSPSSRRAPTAQMVPLPSNAAVTTTPAATSALKTSTASLPSSSPGPVGILRSQAFLPATASPSLPPSAILPSSPKCLSKQSLPQKSVSKDPRITLAPAPATASGAFKDATSAAHVRNTRFLSPVRRQTNGVRKSQHVRTSSPRNSLGMRKSASDEQRERGRPRTRSKERLRRQNAQDKPPILSSTPVPVFQDASNAFTLQQQQQAVMFHANGDPQPTTCAEEPRLWPGRGDYVSTLRHFDSKPEPVHSEPVRACTNSAAHKDSRDPHDHGVCATCRQRGSRHAKATRPELFATAWWPLCKACSEYELRHEDPKRKGCSCCKGWLCFSCQVQELEQRDMKNSVEAELRRTFVGEGMDGDVKTVAMGYACQCGEEIGPNTTLLKCVGCQGLQVGKMDPLEAMTRERAMRKAALAWT